MQLFLENSIEIMGLLMQKITNLDICVLYNCNFLISVKPYIGYKLNQVDIAISLNYCMLYDTVNLNYIELRVIVK